MLDLKLTNTSNFHPLEVLSGVGDNLNKITWREND